jgi:malate/lactate dehydrogenase
MLDIAIIGAGELGGEIAHRLATRNAARAIRLIDDDGRVAEGKALDISQAAAIEAFCTEVSGTAELSAVSGARVVIVADRSRDGAWRDEDGLMLLRRLTQLSARSIVVCADAGHRDLIARGVRDLHIDRRRLFGSAPEALAGGARALVALATNRSPADVALSVLGIPPGHIVIPWNDAAVAGFAATGMLEEPIRRRLDARIVALWPPGRYALAAAVTKAVEAMAGRTRTTLSCFVAPDPSAGQRTRTAVLPVALGPDGIESVLLPSLSVVDRVALDNAMQL